MEHITIVFIAKNQDLVVEHLIALIARHQCHIAESRFSLLGGDFSGILRISGNWNAIAKLEATLGSVKAEKKDLLLLDYKRTEPLPPLKNLLPYVAQVVALDTPEVVSEIVRFFVLQQIRIVDLQTDPFHTHHSDTMMLTISLRLNIPANISIADLREQFMLLCDELNVDGIMEPEKR